MLRAGPELALATLAWIALVLAGCAPVVHARDYAALAELPAPLARVAVAPFRPAGRLVANRDDPGSQSPSESASLVAHHLAEALEGKVEVIPAGDVARALGIEGAPLAPFRPEEIAPRMAAEFGADAVVLGQVTRFVSRSGEAAGSRRPASVAFTVALYDAPGGRQLWEGHFDETQRALFENLFNVGRYPGGGTRWLTAEELTVWGTDEVARALPLSP